MDLSQTNEKQNSEKAKDWAWGEQKSNMEYGLMMQ